MFYWIQTSTPASTVVQPSPLVLVQHFILQLYTGFGTVFFTSHSYIVFNTDIKQNKKRYAIFHLKCRVYQSSGYDPPFFCFDIKILHGYIIGTTQKAD